MIISISLFLIAIGIQKAQKEDESITITQKTKKVKFADDDVEDYEIVDQKPKELDKENKSSLSELKNEAQNKTYSSKVGEKAYGIISNRVIILRNIGTS